MMTFCIQFLALASHAGGPPPQVKQLALREVRRQAEAGNPAVEVHFEEEKCSEKGKYYFDGDALVLESDNPKWGGKREFALADLLEKRRVSFPWYEVPPANPWLSHRLEKEPTPVGSRFLTGAAAGGAAGAIAGFALSPNEESRGLNGLIFGLTGALSGGLFALIWD